MDTSMGMTPLEGLMMGTRSGDVDPAVPLFMVLELGMDPSGVYKLLNGESGLKGICGQNDMREVLRLKSRGDRMAEFAFRMYCYRVKKYIGAYMAVLSSVDALVFTAGIGENSPELRWHVCEGLEKLGVRIDSGRNNRNEREISCPDSPVRVLVIRTNEELMIARETVRVTGLRPVL